jgi:dipeptidyl aminopeptidase/acylaminoacyl peptidase
MYKIKMFWFMFLGFLGNTCIGQSKSKIDFKAIDNWPSFVGRPEISDDGKSVAFFIREYGSDKLIIRSIESKKQYEISNPIPWSYKYNSSSKYLVCQVRGDSLSMMNLANGSVSSLANVGNYLLSSSNKDWLAYKLKDNATKLYLKNIDNDQTIVFDSVYTYKFCKNLNYILLDNVSNDSGTETHNYQIYDYVKNKTTKIGKTLGSGNIQISTSGKLITFFKTTSKGGQIVKSVSIFNTETQKSNDLDLSNILGNVLMNQIEEVDCFSKNNDIIYLKFKHNSVVVPKFKDPSLDIWSYRDTHIQSEQLINLDNSNLFLLCAISITQKKMVFRQMPTENIVQNNGDILILSKELEEFEVDSTLNSSKKQIYCIKNVLTGELDTLRIAWEDTNLPAFSPLGKYVTYFRNHYKDMYSYNLNTKKEINITGGQLIDRLSHDDDNYEAYYQKIVGYTTENKVLVQGPHDVYLVDLNGKASPVNITNGYGLDNKINFSLLEFNEKSIYSPHEEIFFSAFNYETKENGFFSRKMSNDGVLVQRFLGPYFYTTSGNASIKENFPPIKAANANRYIVQRMTTKESPNFYTTTDFKQFDAVSNVHPEKGYHWINSALLNYKSNDKQYQGILYTPDDLDSSKKYPVILHFYERKSDNLHVFKKPNPSEGSINTPWFVTHGYVVFEIDITYTHGHTGNSALQAAIAAANVVSKLSYIDSTKLGIQGFSFGGYETNYIITHTNRFAAAMSGAGMTDLVSDAYSVNGESGRVNGLGNRFHPRPTIANNKNFFVENSPIFHTAQVTTPLLLMNNKEDRAVDLLQAIEFYIALRQSNKRVWLLQYDNYGHGVFDNAAKDYTTRLMQFFDHYLKGALPPLWMTKGRPANLKFSDDRLGLDYSGTRP